MATKRKSPSDLPPSQYSPKRNKEDSPIPTTSLSEPINVFPILPQTAATSLSISDKLLLKYLQTHGSEDAMYSEAIQLLLNSRLSFLFKPNRVLVAVGQTFDPEAGVGDLLRSMPREFKEEEIIFWIFSKFCKHIKSENAVKEIVKIILKGLPEVSSRAKVLEDLAPDLGLETRFFEGGQEVETIHAEKDVEKAEGSEDSIEESSDTNTSEVNMALNVEGIGASLRLIPDTVERCKVLRDIIRHAGLGANEESQDSMMNTTGILIETLLDTLGDIRTKNEVLTQVSLRAGVSLSKDSPEEGPKDDGESETVTGDDPETIKDACEEPTQLAQVPVAPKTPFERLETIMESLDSDESRRHCVRRLAQPLGLEFFRSDHPAETTTGRRAELDEEVGVPQPLRRQVNYERVRQSPRKVATVCQDRSCDCHRPDEFPKDHFTKERWPIVELIRHVLNDEHQAEQATSQRDAILDFLQRRVAGRKCHQLCTSIQLAGKTYEFTLGYHGLVSRQILTALQQSSDSHGGSGETSRRARLDRAVGPFIYANFPLFPELSDCIDLSAYGKPVVLDNTLHLRVEAIYPPLGLTLTKAQSRSKGGGRRQSAAPSYSSPKPPRGPRPDRFQSHRSEKPNRTWSSETKLSEPRSPYPQSPLEQRSRLHDLFPDGVPSHVDQHDSARCHREGEREDRIHWQTPFRQDSDRVAPVAPMGPRH